MGEGRRMKRGKEETMGRRQGVGECTVAEGKKREMCERGEGEERGSGEVNKLRPDLATNRHRPNLRSLCYNDYHRTKARVRML